MISYFSIILASLISTVCAFPSIVIAPIAPIARQSQLNVHSHTHQKISPFDSLSRRNVLSSIPVLASLQYLVSLPKIVNAESSMDLPNGLLEARVLENVLSPPPYEMECSDIFYPR